MAARRRPLHRRCRAHRRAAALVAAAATPRRGRHAAAAGPARPWRGTVIASRPRRATAPSPAAPGRPTPPPARRLTPIRAPRRERSPSATRGRRWGGAVAAAATRREYVGGGGAPPPATATASDRHRRCCYCCRRRCQGGRGRRPVDGKAAGRAGRGGHGGERGRLEHPSVARSAEGDKLTHRRARRGGQRGEGAQNGGGLPAAPANDSTWPAAVGPAIMAGADPSWPTAGTGPDGARLDDCDSMTSIGTPALRSRAGGVGGAGAARPPLAQAAGRGASPPGGGGGGDVGGGGGGSSGGGCWGVGRSASLLPQLLSSRTGVDSGSTVSLKRSGLAAPAWSPLTVTAGGSGRTYASASVTCRPGPRERLTGSAGDGKGGEGARRSTCSFRTGGGGHARRRCTCRHVRGGGRGKGGCGGPERPACPSPSSRRGERSPPCLVAQQRRAVAPPLVDGGVPMPLHLGLKASHPRAVHIVGHPQVVNGVAAEELGVAAAVAAVRGAVRAKRAVAVAQGRP